MTSITGSGPGLSPAAAPTGPARLWNRQLPHYPDTRPRTMYLGLTVLATIVLYYQLYVQGAVATQVIHHFGFSFTEFVLVLVVGNAVGAFASLFAGLADRWGRANLVVGGLFLVGLLVLFWLPNATTRTSYGIGFALVSLIEGIALVATPALIRDFSPQVGRGTAMGFRTMGPVLGSLMVTMISSNTLDTHPDWRFQFYVAGTVGLAVAVIAFFSLRELSPGLRDQLMVSLRDRGLIEARAAGIDPEKALKGHWRQMLKLDVIGSALAISLFLMLYYIFVAFLVVYFATVYDYTEARANSLANWYWITNAVALIVAGLLSDRLRVRKPFMVVGAAISAVGVALFALAATEPTTSYGTFVAYFVVMSCGSGVAYCAWMAAFTETVERHNPAATATGLAVWGWILRIVVTLSFALLPVVVPATTTLVDKGERVAHIVETYPQQVEVLQTVDGATLAALKANPDDKAAQVEALAQLSGLTAADVARVVTLGARYDSELATAAAIEPATQKALGANPADQAAAAAAVGQIATELEVAPAQAIARLQALGKVPATDLAFLRANGEKVTAAAAQLASVSEMPPADLAYLTANGADVAQAQKDNPGQWQTWWWICFAAQILFIPFAFVMAGRWSPRRAREDEIAHERLVERELERLRSEREEPVPAERQDVPVLVEV